MVHKMLLVLQIRTKINFMHQIGGTTFMCFFLMFSTNMGKLNASRFE